MARTAATVSVRIPREVIEELYDASVRFASVLETLEVLMDKQTIRRIKTGERKYSKRQYVVAKGPADVRRALAS